MATIDKVRYIDRTALAPHYIAESLSLLRSLEARLAAANEQTSGRGKMEPSENVSSVGSFPELRAQDVAGATLYANRIDALEALPREGDVAEIGVALGDFTQMMMEKLSPRYFAAFDTFRLHEASHFWGRSSQEWLTGLKHKEFYERRFGEEIRSGRMRVFEGDSGREVARQPDASFDVIYIDGDHSYAGVLRDAENSARKLRRDGVLVFNDYIMMDHVTGSSYGIVPVVNDFCVNRGWTVLYFAFNQHLFCDIAIRLR